ncbi:hypothetical protein KK062_09225 [Fulvivirgaceae bacterium PWU5]|uniref:EF-hand domain-containing protein n=1 Tax=Dawidia cretensis TaxID=2782350 RepID=A0AAP2GPN2_9BACT|nr:hypothetical protein [Dawidia cretensis]MBT1708404.1 hypothetical protein [Dawidia cretensis]
MKTKTTIPRFSSAVAMLVVTSCAAPKSYTAFADWDASSNSAVERNEFVQGYTALNYFEKWSRDKSSITYDEMGRGVFMSLDGNNDGKLSNEEFTSQINLFYFGLFHDRFDGWDDDHNNSVSHAEFDKHVIASGFALTWDTDGDELISKREMAGGMFYVSDANSDGRVTERELDAWKESR